MCQRGTVHLTTLKSKKYSLPKETAEIETVMAEKSSLGTSSGIFKQSMGARTE
jgi:hypothetical protein